MPDWTRYVRENLKLRHATVEDEARAVEELARQLEDAYLDAMSLGVSSEEAENQAKLHITDWKHLADAPRFSRNYGSLGEGRLAENGRWAIAQWMDSAARDLRHATRGLRRSAGFALVAVVTLGLGIGANTVIFSAINSLLLNPAGVPDANRILTFGVNYEKLNIKSPTVSPAEFVDVRDSRDTFSAAGMSATGNYNYSSGGFPERLVGQRVTWQWFEVFGVRPILGRLFTEEEDQPNVNRVVVLEYQTWQNRFGGDASIIDKTIELNQQAFKVIGVLGPEFRKGDVNLWTPLGLPPAAYTPRSRFNESYDLVAKIRPGVSLKQALAHVEVLTERVHQSKAFPGQYSRDNGWSIQARTYPESLTGDLKSPMLVLMGAVGFVLLIACANIAGLMLARATKQARELAVRTALGASRWQLIRQTLTESLLIAIGGLATGIFIAYAGIPLLLAFAPENIGHLIIRLDSRVLAFTAFIGITAGLIFGVIPAFQITASRNADALKEGGRVGTATRRQLQLRSSLVAVEIALALILLVGAGLFLRSLSRLQQVDTGFEPRPVMSGLVALPPAQYREPEKQRAFHRVLLEQLANAPGVTSAATGIPIPFTGESGGAFVLEGTQPQPGQPVPQGRLQVVSPGYFATLGIPLLRGRTFTDQDSANSEPVAVIDENLARQYWPNEDAIGKRIRRTASNAPWTTIVGIVRHVKHSDLAADSGKGVHYYPVYQQQQPVTTFAVLVKTPLEPIQLSDTIRQAVRAADPAQPVFELRTMQDRVLASLSTRRFAVNLMIVFAGVAIFMAAIGLYGVISYVVGQRAHEIGIRMALGARTDQILALILRQGLQMTGAGIVLGVAGASILARLLSSQLFQISSFDPLTFAMMILMVLIVAFLACIVPARRATAVDPLDACRHE